MLSKTANDLHVTLKFLPTWDDVKKLPFGKEVDIIVTGYCNHSLIQCFLVDILGSNEQETKRIKNLCANKYPHITIAFDRDECKPQYSNNLLENSNIIPLISTTENGNLQVGSLRLKGICGGFILHTGVVFQGPTKEEYEKSNKNNKSGKNSR